MEKNTLDVSDWIDYLSLIEVVESRITVLLLDLILRVSGCRGRYIPV